MQTNNKNFSQKTSWFALFFSESPLTVKLIYGAIGLFFLCFFFDWLTLIPNTGMLVAQESVVYSYGAFDRQLGHIGYMYLFYIAVLILCIILISIQSVWKGKILPFLHVPSLLLFMGINIFLMNFVLFETTLSLRVYFESAKIESGFPLSILIGIYICITGYIAFWEESKKKNTAVLQEIIETNEDNEKYDFILKRGQASKDTKDNMRLPL